MAHEEPHYDYPRTRHLPWSPGGSTDDLRLLEGEPETMFCGRRVIVTEKLDGENTSMYNDILHARSKDGRHHRAQDCTDSATYTVVNPQGVAVTQAVTITVDHETPTATADGATTSPDTLLTLPVLHNDHDPTGEGLRLALVPPAATQMTRMGGVITLDDRSTPTDPSDDVLHYAPAPGFMGIDTFTYQVRDLSGHTDTASVSIHIHPSAPRSTDLSVRVDRKLRTLAVDVLAEAHAPSGEALHLHGVSQPAYGSVTLDDGSPLDARSDALLIYTPETGFSGVETVTYWVCDDSDRCDVATVTFRMPPPTSNAEACLMQVRPRPKSGIGEADRTDPEVEMETRSSAHVPQPEGGLTTPLAGDRVAGHAVAVALVAEPGLGHLQSALVPVVVANQAPVDTQDITETADAKTEVLPAAQDHVIVTAQGVIIEVPAGALVNPDHAIKLKIVSVPPNQAPPTLPGIAASDVREVTLTSRQTVVTRPLTLWLPYTDQNQDGNLDHTEPPVPAAGLTLWRYDPQQAAWVHLPEAVLLTEMNMARVETTALGHFALVRADDGRVGVVRTARAYPQVAPAGTWLASRPTSSSAWQTIGTSTTAPYVVAWDTTQVPDGDYELRAICAPDADELTPFASSDSPSSGGGRGGRDCFISAAYGSPWAPPVRILRDFRETYLRPLVD